MPLTLEEIAYDDSDVGYDDIGANPFAFMRRGRGKRRPRMPAPRPRLPSAAAAIMPNVPGAPNRALGLYPASFAPATFVAATGLGSITVTCNPQAPYKCARLTAIVIRNGATAAATVPLIADLRVGMTPAVMTPDGVPAEIFTPNAVDTTLNLPPSEPGVLYSATLRLTAAVTGSDTVIVLLSMVGGSWQ